MARISEVVVQGILSGYRTTVDGGLKVTVELDELQAALFHEGFPGINVTVVIARLGDEIEKSSGGA
jgi:hypothetical protein